jgi:hypothetical protein
VIPRFLITNKISEHSYDIILNLFTFDVAVVAFTVYAKLKQFAPQFCIHL